MGIYGRRLADADTVDYGDRVIRAAPVQYPPPKPPNAHRWTAAWTEYPNSRGLPHINADRQRRRHPGRWI